MSVGHALGRLLDVLGMADVTPHDLRRTMASELSRPGVPEPINGCVLTHAQMSITANTSEPKV